jgi:hypothetical protein
MLRCLSIAFCTVRSIGLPTPPNWKLCVRRLYLYVVTASDRSSADYIGLSRLALAAPPRARANQKLAGPESYHATTTHRGRRPVRQIKSCIESNPAGRRVDSCESEKTRRDDRRIGWHGMHAPMSPPSITRAHIRTVTPAASRRSTGTRAHDDA